MGRSGRGAIAVGFAQIALGKNELDHAGCTGIRESGGRTGKAKAAEVAGAGSTAPVIAAKIPIALRRATERRNRRTGITASCCLSVLAYGNSRGKSSDPEQSLYNLAAICRRGHSTRQSVESSIVHEPSFSIAMLW